MVPDAVPVTQRLPSGPAAIEEGMVPAGTKNSATLPSAAMRPILSAPISVNQTFPLWSTVIPCGRLPGVGIAYSVTKPAVEMRPIFPAPCSLNHRLPSGPLTMLLGVLDGVGR